MKNFDEFEEFYDNEEEFAQEMKELKEKMDNLSQEFLGSQFIHDPRQVKCLDDLEEGKTYLHMNSKFGKVGKFRILSTMPKNGWLNVKLIFDDSEMNYKMHLADHGLAPYMDCDKKWNHMNYVIPAEEK